MKIVASAALTLVCAWSSPALAQPRSAGFPDVVGALAATPGCLGVETAQTPSGKRVIFAWFENKKALVDWYHGDAHQKAMKNVFPNLTFDRQPLGDLAEDSGPILAIVAVKFVDAPRPDATAAPRSGSSSTAPYQAAWRSADGLPPKPSKSVDSERSRSGRPKGQPR